MSGCNRQGQKSQDVGWTGWVGVINRDRNHQMGGGGGGLTGTEIAGAGGVGCNTDRDINHRMGGVTGTEITGY